MFSLRVFFFSTFTPTASISRFTNTLISVQHCVGNADAILSTGTLAWLQKGTKIYNSKCNGFLNRFLVSFAALNEHNMTVSEMYDPI